GVAAIVAAAHAEFLVVGRYPVLKEVARFAGLLAPTAQGSAHFTLGTLWKVDRAGHGVDLSLDADAAEVLRDSLRHLCIVDVAVIGCGQRQLEAIGVTGLDHEL